MEDNRRKKKSGGTLRLLFGKKENSKGGRKIKVTNRKKTKGSPNGRRSRRSEERDDGGRGRGRGRRDESPEEVEGEEEEKKEEKKKSYREKREIRKRHKKETERTEKKRSEDWKKNRKRRSASVSMGNLNKTLRNRYGTLGGLNTETSIRKGLNDGKNEKNKEDSEKKSGDSNWKGFFSPEVKKGKRRRAQSVSRARPSLKRQDSQGLFGTLKNSIFGSGRPNQKSSRTPKGLTPMETMYLSPSKPLGNWDGYEIHEICFEGDVMKLFELVKHNRDLNALNADQNTALHFSCALGKILCVKELLKHHDVNTLFPNCMGDTPLHVASKKGHADIVKSMIKFGRCNMYEKDREGKTCIEVAKNEETKNVFKEQIRIEEKFLSAVTKKRFVTVKKLLIAGVNVNAVREVQKEGTTTIVKRNALDILFSTKKLSSLDEDEKLIRLLLNRGCNVSRSISDYESKYSEILLESYHRGKRYHYLREILQTEKVYVDDLWITLNLFAEPLKDGKRGTEKTRKIFKNIKKKDFRKKLAKFWSCLEDIRKVTLRTSKSLSKKFKIFSYLLRNTDGAELKSRSEELDQAEKELMACLLPLDLEPYITFCYQQSFMEGWIRKKREYSEVYKFYRRQEQLIPLPRIRDGGFVSMLSKVRNRLFKYRGFLECVIKYTDGTQDDYLEILNSVLKHIMDGLEKINRDAGEIENKKQMLSIHRLFKERYNIKMLVQNKNRKYICHETNFRAFDMETLECHECDIYVFSDSVFFGSKKGGGFEFYWYNTKKMIWTWHDDHYRLMIYDKREDGGKKLLDYIVPCSYSYTWFKEMKEFFSKHHPTFYWNHIFLHSAFSFDKEIEEFRLLRNEDDDMKIHRRMMINYKKKIITAEEKLQKFTNKVIEQKKTIEQMRREKKKKSPKASSPMSDRIKKIDLKVRVSFDSPSSSASPSSPSRRLDYSKIRIHTPDEETPVKIKYPNDSVFDSKGSNRSDGGNNEKSKPHVIPRSPFANNPQMFENVHAKRLFNTPAKSSTEEEEEKD